MTARLIINADDFGYEPNVTRGIFEAMTAGVVNSTTLVVNAPNSAEGGALIRANPLAAGLHFNLARFAPCSRAPLTSLDSRGEFDERRVSSMSVADVASELEAQLHRFEVLTGKRPTHIDVHKHLHTHRNVLEGMAGPARDFTLPVRSINTEMRTALGALGVRTNDVFLGDAGSEPYWTLERFLAQLAALPESGVAELMCHPGYALRDFPSGYSKQREVELATLVDPRAKTSLADARVELVTWAAVREER